MKKPLFGLSHYSTMFICFLFLLISCKKSEQKTFEKIDPSREKEMIDYANGPQQSNYTFEQFKSKIDLNKLGSLSKSFLIPTPSREKLMSVNTQDTYKGFALHTDSIKIIKSKDHTSYIFSVKQSSPRAITFQNLTIDEGPDGITSFVNTYVPS
ncbi:hypothetical protein [Flavobacterium sp.]|uniref:hypothetical protein n=1 Tax=Flavobacterium sp. TaxID=239 RepID=UPI003C4167D1